MGKIKNWTKDKDENIWYNDITGRKVMIEPAEEWDRFIYYVTVEENKKYRQYDNALTSLSEARSVAVRYMRDNRK